MFFQGVGLERKNHMKNIAVPAALVCTLVLSLALSGCSKTGDHSSSKVLRNLPVDVMSGKASWYGRAFHGRKTASGERYNMHAFTAAHRTLPFGSWLLVTNLENNKQQLVRINDRGPFIKGRMLDLSYAAAEKLDMVKNGVSDVRIEVFSPDSPPPDLEFALW